MDAAIIQKRVNDLAVSMAAKGIVTPEAQAMIRSDREPTIYLQWSDKSADFGNAYACDSASTLIEAFEKAVERVSKMPSAEQAKLQEFLRALGKAVDIGKQHGIEADYLNPLVASMKKLSKNIITDQRAA